MVPSWALIWQEFTPILRRSTRQAVIQAENKLFYIFWMVFKKYQYISGGKQDDPSNRLTS